MNVKRIISESIDMVIAQKWLNEELERGNKFLSQYGLSVVFNPKYNFNGAKYEYCLAVYQCRSVKNKGRIRISVNFPSIEKYIDEERYEIEVRASIWHEIGHGIVEYLKGLRRKDTQCGTKIFRGQMLKDFREFIDDEEFNVDEFGGYMAHKELYTFSALNDFLNEYQNQILQLKNQEGGNKWMNQFIEK